MLTNAYEHGNLGLTCAEKKDFCERGKLEEELEARAASAYAAGKKMYVRVEMSQAQFRFSVADEGKGFDWRVSPDPFSSPAALSNLNGRGLLIVKRCFDEVIFNESGNEICAIKRLT